MLRFDFIFKILCTQNWEEKGEISFKILQINFFLFSFLKEEEEKKKKKKEEKTKKNDDDRDLNEGERHGDEAEAEVGDSKIGNEHIPAFAITHHHL